MSENKALSERRKKGLNFLPTCHPLKFSEEEKKEPSVSSPEISQRGCGCRVRSERSALVKDLCAAVDMS